MSAFLQNQFERNVVTTSVRLEESMLENFKQQVSIAQINNPA